MYRTPLELTSGALAISLPSSSRIYDVQGRYSQIWKADDQKTHEFELEIILHLWYDDHVNTFSRSRIGDTSLPIIRTRHPSR